MNKVNVTQEDVATIAEAIQENLSRTLDKATQYDYVAEALENSDEMGLTIEDPKVLHAVGKAVAENIWVYTPVDLRARHVTPVMLDGIRHDAAKILAESEDK